MENRYPNSSLSKSDSINNDKTRKGLTPRELIHYHIENPDEPIQDEDIENLILHIPNSLLDSNASIDTKTDAADNRMLSDNELRQAKDNSIITTYDVLGDFD